MLITIRDEVVDPFVDRRSDFFSVGPILILTPLDPAPPVASIADAETEQALPKEVSTTDYVGRQATRQNER